MKILVVNRGSSSIKSSLYDFPKLIWEERCESPKMDAKFLAKLKKLGKIDCIGHRIVHGGKKYTQSAIIDAKLKKEIQKLADIAPLHNKADLEAITIFEKIFPKIPQVAVFDTAFHHALDAAAFTYPGPYAWLAKGIRRYGFHGISFQYCTKKAAEMLGKMPEKMVICHLGSGASLCAVKNGKSIDTTMGFTPLEGLMMDTRSGTVDPGILLHLLRKGKTVKALTEELNQKSGLLGLSGISSDMRDIIKSKDARARLALDVYIHRLCSLIGSMVVALQGIDTLVFTAGIGENASLIRERVCNQLAFLNVSNVLVIHTQEALEIARECHKLCS